MVLVKFRSWQDFEHASRSIIRSMGYYVHHGPYVTHQKEVDIYGRHHRFYSWVNGELRQDLFIGECKNWNNPVNASVIYELKGLLNNIRRDHNVRGAVFASNGASKRAIEAAKAVNIMIFDTDDIAAYLKDIFRQKETGKLERPSFPGYTKISQLMELTGAIDISVNTGDEFYSGDIKAVLKDQFNWKESTVKHWTISLLNVAALLGIIEFVRKDGNKNIYSPNSETSKLYQLWKKDPDRLNDVLRPMVLKNIFVREIVYLLLIQGPTQRADIGRTLEYTRPGFDEESIFMAIKLARDFGLLEKVDPNNHQSPLRATNIAENELWK